MIVEGTASRHIPRSVLVLDSDRRSDMPQRAVLTAATVYTMSPGRIGAIVAGLLALIGVVFGGLALASATCLCGERSP